MTEVKDWLDQLYEGDPMVADYTISEEDLEPVIFHGACRSCTQQEVTGGTNICIGCRNFAAEWNEKPDLNNKQPSKADTLRAEYFKGKKGKDNKTNNYKPIPPIPASSTEKYYKEEYTKITEFKISKTNTLIAVAIILAVVILF